MTNNYFLPYSLPQIEDEEIEEVISTLRSGWITTGSRAKLFEQSFVNYLGDPDLIAVAVNSATAGLHLALEALGVVSGDEVITTTHTFTATAEVVRYLGATPIFVDIHPSTLCIDVSAIERAITPRTKVILPVHFAGHAANMNEILKISKKYNIYVVEDASHAFPATCDGKMIGTLNSDATIFSFYANKTITTAEGGMLVTRHPHLADRSKVMRLHGINRDSFNRFNSKFPSWYYEVIAPGFKYNMTDIAASLGLVQLKKAENFRKHREKISFLYDSGLKSQSIILPPRPKNGDLHSWHIFAIQLSSENNISRDKFIEEMYKNNIGCSVHYIPLHLHPYWRDTYSLIPEMFPVSQRVYERTISLPIYSKMHLSDAERVIKTINNILK